MSQRYRIYLCGPFRVLDRSGREIIVRSRKGRALIALLACSPNGERSRAWLQSLLWGRCGTPEAQGSLRQEVSRLRSIDGLGELVESTALSIRLRRDLVIVDVDTQGSAFAGELLEGFDLPHEEAFEDWLREERTRLSAQHRTRLQPAIHVIDRPLGSSGKLCIALLPAIVDETDVAILREAEAFLDTLALTLLQTGIVDIADIRDIDARLAGRTDVAPDVELRLRLTRSGREGCVTLRMNRVSGRTLLFQKSATIDLEAGPFRSVTGAILVQEMSDQILHALVRRADWKDDPRHLAAKHLFLGIEQMFSLSPGTATMAERNFSEACRLMPHSVAYAWRAYHSVTMLDEPNSPSFKHLYERARESMRLAEELDPYNGLSLALLSHVSSFVMRDFEKSADFLARADAASTDHVMFHDAKALFNFYTGDLAQARIAAHQAELRGRHLPFRYCFATTKCMIAALAGDMVEAIREGERALKLQPVASLPYAPTLRYLGASYSAIGAFESASSVFSRLKQRDPRTSSRLIDTTSYPTPADHAASFIRAGLAAVSM